MQLKSGFFFVFCLCFNSCSTEKSEPINEVQELDELFTVLQADDTGLNFNNKLEESTYMNGFYYEYFYNGGGVAVADFNNDGLEDIYFISNLRTNKLYLNQGELQFKNVSVKANAQGKGGFPTGVALVDINDDGLMDIYILKSGRFDDDDLLRNELLINTGVDANQVPIFEERARDYGLDLPHYSTQASFFDYDRDGDLDMFLINHNIEIYEIDEVAEVMEGRSDKIGEKLYRNDNGNYVNVTDKSGIISNNLGFTLGLAIGDLNSDGWPDIYTSNDYYEKDHLYLNNQDGTFSEKSLDAFGHISTFSMGNDIADINNDGLLDIVSLDMMAQDNYTQKTSMSGMNVADFYMIENLSLHRQYMYNALQLNNGNDPNSDTPQFSDIAQLAGVSSTDWSWAPLLFDMDNDGHRDLFVSNGIKRDFRNNDFLIYLEKKYQEGVMKTKLDLAEHVDDLLEKLPARKKENYFFLNNKQLRFNKTEIVQPGSYSSGAAYADFDQDGDIDLVVNNTDDFAYLYRNNTQNSNYIKIKLQGAVGNRDAIGTRVEIMAGENRYLAEKYYTRGFQSSMAIPLHFGLGDQNRIDSLIVIWPDGKSQFLLNVEVNKELTVAYNPDKNNIGDSPKRGYKFSDITKDSGIRFKHDENEYNDFDKESLIPHKMSQHGPCLSVADVNNDGLDDFFIGGAMGQSGSLFLQNTSGKFSNNEVETFNKDSFHEDNGSLFFDADNDGDQDLYVVSGGNEKEAENSFYLDRFYVNDGIGNFTRSMSAIPDITESGQVVKAGDYDNDGDLDLFVGSRVSPMNYGYPSKSYLLENKSTSSTILFEDVTESTIPDMLNHGMVTDALWVDIDASDDLELIVAHEWGSIEAYKTVDEKFVNISSSLGLDQHIGWWYSLAATDVDNDGDIDLIAGNLGLNYKYKATNETPFHLYLNDFDQNKSNDIVLGYHQGNSLYPLRGRECTSNQMPFIKEKFKTYDAFGKATLQEVYGDKLNASIHVAANNFASGIFRNVDNQRFEFEALQNGVQVSSMNKILVSDLNKDKNKDLIMFGNLYGSEVETPRNDASYGHYMKGNGNGNLTLIPAYQSGLYVKGDVNDASLINIGNKEEKRLALLIARNNDQLMLVKVQKIKE
ncbi:MAG: hypothetical protein ACI83W_001326 [Marinoscillum sp.]|jgi:hypothetical protein